MREQHQQCSESRRTEKQIQNRCLDAEYISGWRLGRDGMYQAVHEAVVDQVLECRLTFLEVSRLIPVAGESPEDLTVQILVEQTELSHKQARQQHPRQPASPPGGHDILPWRTTDCLQFFDGLRLIQNVWFHVFLDSVWILPICKSETTLKGFKKVALATFGGREPARRCTEERPNLYDTSTQKSYTEKQMVRLSLGVGPIGLPVLWNFSLFTPGCSKTDGTK